MMFYDHNDGDCDGDYDEKHDRMEQSMMLMAFVRTHARAVGMA